MDEAARIALRTVLDQTARLSSVRRIRFVLYPMRTLAVHRAVLKDLVGGVEAFRAPS